MGNLSWRGSHRIAYPLWAASSIGAWIASPGIQKGHVAVQLGGGWTGISGLESSTNSDW